MRLNALAGVALAALLIPAPAAAERAPSAHIRCDGLPDNITAGETAARLIGAVTLLGLFAPQHETADASQRVAGAEGVAVCTQALSGESNESRRAQLILGGAIHQIEAEQYDAAIAAARQADSDRPALAASRPFRLSLHLSALDVEAFSLLQQGHTDAAIAKALEMASAAPYDLNNQILASYYLYFSTRWDPAQQAFYDNLVRLYPPALGQRAFLRELNGDVPGALADYDLLIRLHDTQLGGASASMLARVALSNALAGRVERARELIARTQAPPPAGGKQATSGPNPVAVELADFYRVWQAAHDGDLAGARTLFLARSQWIYTDAAVRSAMVRVLRQGATPAQLTGGLAHTPESIVEEFRTERRSAGLNNKGPGEALFGRLRPNIRAEDFARFSRDVWRTEGSRIIDFPLNENDDYHVYSTTRVGGGTPAGYALLLHVALLARSQGHNAFTLFPTRSSLLQVPARTGNRGDEGMIADLTFDAERVIADLAPLIPQPVR